MATISFFLFAKILALGKCGKHMVWKDKSKATHKLHKKSCFGLALIVVVSIFLMKEAGHFKHIMKKVHKKQEAMGLVPPEPRHFEEGEKFTVDGDRRLNEVSVS